MATGFIIRTSKTQEMVIISRVLIAVVRGLYTFHKPAFLSKSNYIGGKHVSLGSRGVTCSYVNRKSLISGGSWVVFDGYKSVDSQPYHLHATLN